MSNLNLGDKIKDFFKSLIATTSQYYLSFEPIGQNIDLDDFKIDDKIDSNLAREITSKITNFIPNTEDVLGLGEELEDVYNTLVLSSQYAEPTGEQTLNSDDLSLFGQVRQDAMLLPHEYLASISTANESFAPVSTFPDDWFDPTKTANWKTHSFPVTQAVNNGNGGTTNKGKTGTNNDQLLNVWKLDSADTKLPDSMINKAVFLTKDVKTKTAPVKIPLTNLSKIVNLNTLNATKVLPVTPAKTSTGTGSNITNIGIPTNFKIQGADVFNPKMRGLENEVADTSRSLELKASNLNYFRAVFLPQRLKLYREYYQQQTKPPTQEVITQNFNISFSYCLVRIERNWFSRQFLKLNNWYIRGKRAGEYSNGQALGAKGEIPAVPSAFLLIKDLEITGNWDTRDLAVINQALGLGPFDLSDKQIDGTKIKVPGMQIIGWVCEVVPFIPAKDDPNMI